MYILFNCLMCALRSVRLKTSRLGDQILGSVDSCQGKCFWIFYLHLYTFHFFVTIHIATLSRHKYVLYEASFESVSFWSGSGYMRTDQLHEITDSAFVLWVIKYRIVKRQDIFSDKNIRTNTFHNSLQNPVYIYTQCR